MRSRFEKVRDYVRREPLTATLFLVAAIAALVPVWRDRYLPLLDWPNHLSNVFVWRHLHDPRWGFDRYYATNLSPLPYWAQYATVYLLAIPFSVETAQKIFLSLILLAGPLSVALYARRMGRDPRLALFAFALAWNVNLEFGFLSYVAGVPLLFFALTALDRHAEDPSWKWGGLAALLGATIYFMHILPWGLFLAVGGASALLAPRPWKWWRAIAAGLPTLPALAIGLFCYRAGRTMQSSVNPWSERGLAGFEGVYNDIVGNLGTMPGWLLNVVPGGFDEVALFALGACWIALLTSRALAPDPIAAADPDDKVRSWRLELAALVALTLYLKLPRSLIRPFYWYAVNKRLAVVVAIFAILIIRGRIAGARRYMLWVAGAIAIALPLNISAHFHRFNQHARDFESVMEPVPPRGEVLALMLNLGDPEVNVNAFNQWGTYVQMRQGGYLLFNFPLDFPLKYIEKKPTPPWDRPELFSFAQYGSNWEWYLIHGPHKNDPFAGAHDKVRLVKQVGDWELWQRL